MRRFLYVCFLTLTAACSRPPERDLSELVLRDSTYLEPGSLEPYSGPVYRFFPDDSTTVQLKGALLEGTWHGELAVYHPNGRLRYLGSLDAGVKCGAWIENRDSEPPASIHEEFKQEIESMGLYPPCPGDG